MFTGIIEEVGRVARVSDRSDTREIVIEAPGIASELGLGDSVSVDGACQTVVHTEGDRFTVESIGTTLSRTVVGGYEVGTRVNLERAMVLGRRLDGHLVQGHVDGVGELTSSREDGGFWLLDFRIPSDVWRQTILHGSIAINGISLTVNRLDPPDRCQVGIIPHTWEHTNLKDLRASGRVNLEGDLIGKYVGRMLASREPDRGLGLEEIEELGY
jgi:riboflavin synthase